jgi:hypothetical protein
MILEQLAESVVFSAGEISPRLRNRRDLSKRQAGVAKLENMVVLVEGGVDRRPGTKFVFPLKNEGELAATIRFLFSTTDSYLLVFNGGAIRFVKNGGYVQSGAAPYEVAMPYLAADLRALRATQSGNEVYLTCAGYAPQVLRRNGPVDWVLVAYAGENGPVDTQNVDTTRTITVSAFTGAAITVTAAGGNLFDPDDVGTIWRIDEKDLSSVPLWAASEAALVAGNQRRYNGNVYEVVSGADSGVNPPTVDSGDFNAGQGKVVWRFLHSGYGLIRITAVGSSTSATADVVSRLPNSVVSPLTTYRWWPPSWSEARGWPDKTTIFQDRLWFFRGDQLWATETDLFYRFLINFQDDGAIASRLRSDAGSLVVAEWAVASGVLVLGMRDGEWLLRATAAAGQVTATDIKPIPGDGTEGSTAHIPAKVDGGVVFIGRDKKRLHFVEFNFQTERLDPQEITLAARHILSGLAIGLTFQRDPNRILWVPTESGELVAFTFMPVESVLGAHRHPMTNGFVENAETIFSADGSQSDTYFVVRRTINGQTRRYIEQLTSFFTPQDLDAPTAEGAWFVDCGLRYTGPATMFVTGLDHLEGQEVAVHADGNGHARKIVAGGRIDLDRAAADVVVGLPIAYRVRSLPFELSTSKGPSKGMSKRATHAVVDVVQGSGGMLASNDGPPTDLVETGGESYAAPRPLFTGPIRTTQFSPAGDEAILEVFGADTMPLTIVGLAPDLDVAGA